MRQSKFTFVHRILAVILLLAVIGPVCTAAGNTLYNQINISLRGTRQVQAGQTYTAQNGQSVPSSITYTDDKGGLTNYLAVRQISEILDADLYWDAETATIELGRDAPLRDDGPTITLEDGTIIGISKDNVKREAKSTAPYTEVTAYNPYAQNEPIECVALLPESRFQCESAFGFEHHFSAKPTAGQYVSIIVTNNYKQSDEPIYFQISREKTIGSDIRFQSVPIQPGQTVMRTLEIAPDANPLTYRFLLNITPYIEDYKTDLTVKVVQFDKPS